MRCLGCDVLLLAKLEIDHSNYFFNPSFPSVNNFERITKAVEKKMVAGCGVNELLQRRWAKVMMQVSRDRSEELGRDQTSGPETTS